MAKSKTPTNLSDLTADPKNARRHPEKNLDMITDSLKEFGAGRSIVIDEKNQVIAGNGTVQAAARAGITKVRVIESDGAEIVAVKLSHLSADEKVRMALFDNRTSETAEWDPAVLEQMAKEGVNMTGIFSQDELDAMADSDEAAAVEPMAVGRPTEIAWVLVAVPMSAWPQCQAAVETLQGASVFSTMVLRPKEPEKEAKRGK